MAVTVSRIFLVTIGAATYGIAATCILVRKRGTTPAERSNTGLVSGQPRGSQ